MRRLAATGMIALLGCRVGAEIDLAEGPTPPQPESLAETKAGEPAPQPWPEPEREPIVFPSGAAIVEVVQFELVESHPKKWRLDPHGNWLADPSGDGCDVWDIESGLRLGHWSDPQTDPCTQWPGPELVLGYGIEPSSHDGALTASISKAEVEIFAGGAQVRTLACRGCAEVRAFAWEPRGHRLAIVREGGGVELFWAYRVTAAEIALGGQLWQLKPTIEHGWLNPTQIAARHLGVSPQRVGQIITLLGLRDSKVHSKAVLNKAVGRDRAVVSHLYSPAAVGLIERELRSRGYRRVE
jgi:hypothetical protein